MILWCRRVLQCCINLYSRQIATLLGIYGTSYSVLWTPEISNHKICRNWLRPCARSGSKWAATTCKTLLTVCRVVLRSSLLRDFWHFSIYLNCISSRFNVNQYRINSTPVNPSSKYIDQLRCDVIPTKSMKGNKTCVESQGNVSISLMAWATDSIDYLEWIFAITTCLHKMLCYHHYDQMCIYLFLYLSMLLYTEQYRTFINKDIIAVSTSEVSLWDRAAPVHSNVRF